MTDWSYFDTDEYLLTELRNRAMQMPEGGPEAWFYGRCRDRLTELTQENDHYKCAIEQALNDAASGVPYDKCLRRLHDAMKLGDSE